MWLLVLADYKLSTGVLNYLNNNTLMGTDNYHKTPTAAYDVLYLLRSKHHHNHNKTPVKWRFFNTMTQTAQQFQEVLRVCSQISLANNVNQRYIFR